MHTTEAQGELYARNGSYYLRYTEPDQDFGRTTATVKWDERQVKVIRRGGVESELTFVAGERTAGAFALPQGRVRLEVVTLGVERDMNEGLGTLAWSYDMYTDGDYAGRMRLRLVIEEDRME